MSSSLLSKDSSEGAIQVKKTLKKTDIIRYLARLAGAVLMFNSAGDLIAAQQPVFRQPETAYTANGAIALTSGYHVLEKTSAAAMTVAAPTAAIEGTEMTIITNTDFAHVVTFTGSTLLDGTTGANQTVTFTAFKGSSITIIARGTKWLLKHSSNVTSIVP